FACPVLAGVGALAEGAGFAWQAAAPSAIASVGIVSAGWSQVTLRCRTGTMLLHGVVAWSVANPDQSSWPVSTRCQPSAQLGRRPRAGFPRCRHSSTLARRGGLPFVGRRHRGRVVGGDRG